MSSFHHHAFHRIRSFAFSTPRRPRQPLLRFALGVLGVALLLVLLVAGVFIGVAMLIGGMLWRLWARRGKPMARPAARPNSIDGDFRVVGKAHLPLAR